MNERRELILETIIREHIATGIPVGSSSLVRKYQLDISPATVRNEMASLEEEGYIAQPHTSAGRVPTEEAYRFFLSCVQNTKLEKTVEKALEAILSDNQENNFREAAKAISQITGSTIFWAFNRHNLYYTGISSLFQQPEFKEVEAIYDISAVIDRMDEIIAETFDQLEMGENVLIGSDNPFGNFCSSIMMKYKLDGTIGLFGILGPMRMNYEKNLALLHYVNRLINNK